MIATDLVHRVKRTVIRALALTAILAVAACVIAPAIVSRTWAAFLLGSVVTGLIWIIAHGIYRERKAMRRRRASVVVMVIGRDLPAPSSIPTAYRVGKSKGLPS